MSLSSSVLRPRAAPSAIRLCPSPRPRARTFACLSAVAAAAPPARPVALRTPLSHHSLTAARPPRHLGSACGSARRYSSHADLQPPDYLNDAERDLFNKLKAELQPQSLEVQDISGGCGSMYAMDIVSEKFAGLSVIKQHKLVNAVLKEEIKGWHGVQLKTKAP